MFKSMMAKIKHWYQNRELKDYYDPFAGLCLVAQKKAKQYQHTKF